MLATAARHGGFPKLGLAFLWGCVPEAYGWGFRVWGLVFLAWGLGIAALKLGTCVTTTEFQAAVLDVVRHQLDTAAEGRHEIQNMNLMRT